MKRLLFSSIIASALMLAVPSAPAHAAVKRPKGATAECKDGTYSTAKNKQGACSAHGGVRTWLAEEKDDAKPAPIARSEKPVAKAPAKAGDPTAQCNDGTYSYAVHHQGACSGHKGVKTWFK